MSNIKFADFEKLDIRIGTVIKAEVPEWSHWVMKLSVDFGLEIGERIIFAGIMKFYKAEDLENKQFPFVINIEPKKIGPEGDFSQGMILAADFIKETTPLRQGFEGDNKPEDGKPVLFYLTEKVPNGTKVR